MNISTNNSTLDEVLKDITNTHAKLLFGHHFLEKKIMVLVGKIKAKNLLIGGSEKARIGNILEGGKNILYVIQGLH